ncbi:LysR family transcriptional regulator [Agrobacterium rhizogenes]|uniref:HTH-type transcriptional regulator TtuA n=2 Tax=unclassified Rhizobium TaxID=2613769 RepID=A0AAU7SIC5_9HYPH|nr:LysR family transcriptional regulator [Rhizobium rhizogenes]NTJ80957.1 LysR family transcriptional regulator [Rhizobium rhizogenes]
MLRENIHDLLAFVVVAREKSFTRAAAQLGMSQSGLSHAIRGLEERLGLRLLTRTTRQVAPTTEGDLLLSTLGPRLKEIENELTALTERQERPVGNFRITAEDYAVMAVLRPKLQRLIDYPDIKVEIIIDYGLTDIIGDRFDAGVRLGGIVSQGMIAVPIGPAMRMIVVAAPSYMNGREMPCVPQDLTNHSCINLRLPTHGGLYAWEFEKDREELRVRVDGQLICNSVVHIYNAALDGFGFAYLEESLVAADLATGRLVQVLDDWCAPFEGYHLYYPTRRQSSPAFGILVDALRHRE